MGLGGKIATLVATQPLLSLGYLSHGDELLFSATSISDGMTYPIRFTGSATLALCCLIPAWILYKGVSKQRSRRPELVPPEGERVLILGASSGIGRVLSLKYVQRGAKICVVARRSEELEAVRSECQLVVGDPYSVFSVCADFTDAEALITIPDDDIS